MAQLFSEGSATHLQQQVLPGCAQQRVSGAHPATRPNGQFYLVPIAASTYCLRPLTQLRESIQKCLGMIANAALGSQGPEVEDVGIIAVR